MTILIVSASALASLSFILGFGVSLMRNKEKVSIGYDDKNLSSPLTKFCRAHSNHSEYAPVLIALMGYIQLSCSYKNVSVPFWIQIVSLGCLISRILLTLGLTLPADLKRPSVFRRLGGVGNYVFGLALAVSVLFV